MHAEGRKELEAVNGQPKPISAKLTLRVSASDSLPVTAGKMKTCHASHMTGYATTAPRHITAIPSTFRPTVAVTGVV